MLSPPSSRSRNCPKQVFVIPLPSNALQVRSARSSLIAEPPPAVSTGTNFDPLSSLGHIQLLLNWDI